MPEVITKESASGKTPSSTPLFKKFSKKTIVIASAVVFMLLLVTMALLVSPASKDEANLTDKTQEKDGYQSQNGDEDNEVSRKDEGDGKTITAPTSAIIFGAWRGQKSVITSFDLYTNTTTELAVLPLNIKKVSILSPNLLLYIDQTNDQDHGKQISGYSLKDKKTTTLAIKASPGFGIDDYVLSPNKEYAAIWEVALSKETNVLQGGRSRVFTVKLSEPTTKNLIYDESATGPIHYPRAVLNNGRVLSDRFQPNDPAGGAGWAYGMSVSDFNGSNKKSIDQMSEGTYGTKPSVSPDGKLLVFGGYDGKFGDGKAAPSGFRQALLTPTTVEVLDTTTLERKKLANLTNNDIYPTVEWGKTSNEVMLTVISKSQERDGLFTYDLKQQSSKKLTLPDSSQEIYSHVTNLSGESMLIGTAADESTSALGNLGDGYQQSLTKLYLFNPKLNQAAKLPVQEAYVQYITTVPSKYFQTVLGIKAYAQGGNPQDPRVTIIDLYSDKPTEENLQLKTFLLKPSLDKEREEQQSDPLPTPTPKPGMPVPTRTRMNFTLPKTINCKDLAREQCGKGWHSSDCVRRKGAQLKEQGKCNQSPLYLYGAAGTNVNVQILTTVYNDKPAYNNGYDITLSQNGNMLIGGNSYSAINYDYQSNLRRLSPPTRGTVAKRTDIEKVLRSYAKKLGLNEKETIDLVKVGEEKTASPYVFISFFDQRISEQILPISFTPKPDNYLNVVFYFKQYAEEPAFTPDQPEFGKPLTRTGFTAVEVSEIIE